MRNSNWVRNGLVTYRAFILRPGSQEYPPETELSLGLTPESAIEELRENHGVGRLSVLAVHELPHSLMVGPDPENNTKAYLHGLPLFSTDEQQRGHAMTIATDLSRICFIVAPPPN
jgi:hypothetical protein